MSTRARLEFGLAIDLGVGPAFERLERARRLVALAEDHGFRSVWAGESYPTAGESFHASSPLLFLAALASLTSLRLGTGVTLLPAWHPLRLAYDAAALDRITGGRLTLGVGIGTPALWRRFSGPSVDVGGWADEALQALRELWSGADGFRGRHLVVEGGVAPPPAQPGGPPLWVGGRVARATRRAAERGDGWYAATNYRIGEIERQAGRYAEECARLGKPVGAVAVNRLAVVSGSRDAAISDGGRALEAVVSSYVAMGAILGDDRRPADPLRDPGLLEDLLLTGDPDAVNEQVQRYATAGVTHLQARVLPGDLPLEVAERTIKLLGTEVLPAWRG